MKVLKRAFLYLSRKKSHTVVLFLIIFILGNIYGLAISLKQVSSVLAYEMKSQLGSTATYINEAVNDAGFSMDTQQDWECFKRYERIVHKLINSTYVSYGNYSYMLLLDDRDGQVRYGYGVSHAPMADVKENIIRIIEGREFTEEELENGERVVIVSNDFRVNGQEIHAGDTIHMKLVFDKNICDENDQCESVVVYDEEYSLKVIGIFEKIDKAFDHVNVGFSDVPGRMYIPNQTLWDLFVRRHQLIQELNVFEVEQMAIDVPIIRLKSSDDLEAFKQEAETVIASEQVENSLMQQPKEQFLISDDDYLSVAEPIRILNHFGNYLCIGGIIAFSIILCIVMINVLQERIHEIGIYLVLGEKKRNILIQLFCELLLVTVLSVSCSLVSSKKAGERVSHSFLDYQSQMDVSYEISIDHEYILSIYGLSVCTIVVAMFYPFHVIITYDPKDILMKK